MDESSLSDSSKDRRRSCTQPLGIHRIYQKDYRHTKSSIGKNADNNDGVKVSVLGCGDIPDVHDSSSETATAIARTMWMVSSIGNTSRSVNNSSVALAFALHYVERDRRVDPVTMVFRRSDSRERAGASRKRYPTRVLLAGVPTEGGIAAPGHRHRIIQLSTTATATDASAVATSAATKTASASTDAPPPRPPFRGGLAGRCDPGGSISAGRAMSSSGGSFVR